MRQIKSRASSKISMSINENLKNVPNERRTETLVTALKKCDELSKIIDHCRKPPVKPRGISRCSNELINQVWSFWKENSTVTNARTSRPGTMKVADIKSDPLLFFIYFFLLCKSPLTRLQKPL